MKSNNAVTVEQERIFIGAVGILFIFLKAGIVWGIISLFLFLSLSEALWRQVKKERKDENVSEPTERD